MATNDVHDEWDAAERPAEVGPLRVLLYSDHVETREQVMLAVGRRITKDLPSLEWVQVATAPAAVAAVDAGGIDLLVLDGDAGKAGGMGLSRQLKDEIYNCPPVLVLIGRPQDAWLASWSQAEAVVQKPLDPMVLQRAVAELLRGSRVA